MKYILQSMVTVRSLFRTQISKMIFFLKRLNSFQQKAFEADVWEEYASDTEA